MWISMSLSAYLVLDQPELHYMTLFKTIQSGQHSVVGLRFDIWTRRAKRNSPLPFSCSFQSAGVKPN